MWTAWTVGAMKEQHSYFSNVCRFWLYSHFKPFLIWVKIILNPVNEDKNVEKAFKPLISSKGSKRLFEIMLTVLWWSSVIVGWWYRWISFTSESLDSKCFWLNVSGLWMKSQTTENIFKLYFLVFFKWSKLKSFKELFVCWNVNLAVLFAVQFDIFQLIWGLFLCWCAWEVS